MNFLLYEGETYFELVSSLEVTSLPSQEDKWAAFSKFCSLGPPRGDHRVFHSWSLSSHSCQKRTLWGSAAGCHSRWCSKIALGCVESRHLTAGALCLSARCDEKQWDTWWKQFELWRGKTLWHRVLSSYGKHNSLSTQKNEDPTADYPDSQSLGTCI